MKTKASFKKQAHRGKGTKAQRVGFFSISLLFLFIFTQCSSAVEVSAPSAVLIDAKTGKILYEKNSRARRAPASTTKIMTTIIALENGNLADTVKVGKRAKERAAGESSAWLEVGEVQTLEDILYCIMVKSANDAAIAAAEHISGSVEKFVELMNNKAHDLGLTDTHFANPHGFYGEKHYTSAFDLAMMARYGMLNYPKFRELSKTKRHQIRWANHPWDRVLINRNKLLWKYKYADGVKTGTTDQAGHCLVASATKDGWQLIAVVLKSGNTYADTTALFEYGFSRFQPHTLIQKNQPIENLSFFFGAPSSIKAVASDKLHQVLKRSEIQDAITKKVILKKLSLPLKKGGEVGKLEFYSGGALLGSVPLVSPVDVEKNWKKMSAVYGAPFLLSSLLVFRKRARRKTPRRKRVRATLPARNLRS